MVQFMHLPSILLFAAAVATGLNQVFGYYPHSDCRSIPIDCLMTDALRYHIACKSSCLQQGYNVGICTADATCMVSMTKYRCDCYRHGTLVLSFVSKVKPY